MAIIMLLLEAMRFEKLQTCINLVAFLFDVRVDRHSILLSGLNSMA